MARDNGSFEKTRGVHDSMAQLAILRSMGVKSVADMPGGITPEMCTRHGKAPAGTLGNIRRDATVAEVH